MEKAPFFSIVIPTYNRADTVISSVESVLDQTFRDFEVIVIDDGSTDETRKVIEGISDARIKYFWKENGERGAARNFGISKSAGDYITFLDSDDRLLCENLNKANNFIANNESPEWFHFAYKIVDPKGIEMSRVTHSDNPEGSLLTGNSLSCLGVFVRHDIINRFNFEEDRDLAGSEDWVLWMKLASRFPLLTSNEVTAELVYHKNRSVLNIVPEKLENRILMAGNLVTEDQAFKEKYSRNESKVWAHLNLYTSLHLAIAKQYKRATQYLIKSFREPSVLLTRKPYAVLKKLIFK